MLQLCGLIGIESHTKDFRCSMNVLENQSYVTGQNLFFLAKATGPMQCFH